MIDNRARLTAPPIYSVQITAVMLYYPQNGYRSRENQCDKPEAMGTGNPCMAADRQDQHPELATAESALSGQQTPYRVPSAVEDVCPRPPVGKGVGIKAIPTYEIPDHWRVGMSNAKVA